MNGTIRKNEQMTTNIENILTLIAQKHLGIETLEIRNSDCLDFHEVSASKIKEALQAAFMAGCEIGITTSAATETGIAA